MRFYAEGFGFLELLVVLIVIGILSVPLLRALQSLKNQNHKNQSFLLDKSSLHETRLFLNKKLSLARPDSVLASRDSLSFESFDELFMPSSGADYMDFSLKASAHVVRLAKSRLYFDGYLLLRGVRLFEAILEAPLDSSGQALLVYRICPLSGECVEDFVFLEETEIIRKKP